MADTVKWLHYAGKTRPVESKQSAWEGSAAHPERDGAKSEVGGSTEMLVDGHSGHGGASNGDDGAPVVAVDKRSNQSVIEHHGNKTKLKACQARVETDRGALATAKRTRR